MNLEDKPNRELQSLLKELEMEHESVKQKILRAYDELEGVEKKYAKIKRILNDRLH
jgi:septal ring factor EnvC (AmiA/AmiB activator)